MVWVTRKKVNFPTFCALMTPRMRGSPPVCSASCTDLQTPSGFQGDLQTTVLARCWLRHAHECVLAARSCVLAARPVVCALCWLSRAFSLLAQACVRAAHSVVCAAGRVYLAPSLSSKRIWNGAPGVACLHRQRRERPDFVLDFASCAAIACRQAWRQA